MIRFDCPEGVSPLAWAKVQGCALLAIFDGGKLVGFELTPDVSGEEKEEENQS